MVTLSRRVGEKLTLTIGPYRVELEVLQAGNGSTTLILNQAPCHVSPKAQLPKTDPTSPAWERRGLENNPDYCYGG